MRRIRSILIGSILLSLSVGNLHATPISYNNQIEQDVINNKNEVIEEERYTEVMKGEDEEVIEARSEAKPIAVGEDVADIIRTGESVNRYSFVTEQKMISIKLRLAAKQEVLFKIFDEWNNEIISTLYSNGLSAASDVSGNYALPEEGKYYIEIQSYNGTTGIYKMCVNEGIQDDEDNEEEEKPDNSIKDAKEIGLETYIQEYWLEDSSHWYKFKINKEGVLKLNYYSNAGASYVRLEDEQGMKYLETEYGGMGGRSDTHEINVVPGQYYINIIDRIPTTGDMYEFNISFEEKKEDDMEESPLAEFVKRLFLECLGREADRGGLEYWVEELQYEGMTGADIGQAFANSDEMKDRGFSESEYIDTLYKAFFNRAADEEGKAYWLKQLADPNAQYQVLASFINSKEYEEICESYGITRGEMPLQAMDLYPKITEFISMFYTKCMDRTASRVELNYWVGSLADERLTGKDVANHFINSEEFKGKNLTDESYIEVMYQVFFNRIADQEGSEYWIGLLKSGASRQNILEQFSQSKEFESICEVYGIKAGIQEINNEVIKYDTNIQIPSSSEYLDTINEKYYWNWASSKQSYLFKEDDGSLCYAVVAEKKIYIYYLDNQFNITSQYTIPCELSILGSMYKSGNYFYAIYGQENRAENPELEVYRIVKYTYNGQKVGEISLKASQTNTQLPFEAGCARMALEDDILYIHGSRQRLKSDDGKNHQSNISFEVDANSMTLRSVSESFPKNHVSHSFNQFVKVDNGTPVYVDHGDAYPRSICVTREGQRARLFSIAGEIGENYTGVRLGGFEIVDTNYMIAASSVIQDAHYEEDKVKNVFVSTVSKNNFTTANGQVKWLTNYVESDGITIDILPKLIKISDKRCVVMWVEETITQSWFEEPTRTLKYAVVDKNGNLIGDIQVLDYAPLADCDPVRVGNQLVWLGIEGNKVTGYTVSIE